MNCLTTIWVVKLWRALYMVRKHEFIYSWLAGRAIFNSIRLDSSTSQPWVLLILLLLLTMFALVLHDCWTLRFRPTKLFAKYFIIERCGFYRPRTYFLLGVQWTACFGSNISIFYVFYSLYKTTVYININIIRRLPKSRITTILLIFNNCLNIRVRFLQIPSSRRFINK